MSVGGEVGLHVFDCLAFDLASDVLHVPAKARGGVAGREDADSKEGGESREH